MDRRLVLAILLILGTAARADEQGFGLDALRGLRRMSVVVDPIAAEAEREGVRRTTLQADAELRLRRAGLSIVYDRTYPEDQAATLRVRLDHMRRDLDSGPVHEFRLTLEVVQTVQLSRDPAVQSARPVWSRTMGGTHLTSTLIPAVRDALRQTMEHLLDDMLAANAGAVPHPVRERPRARPEGD